jgi:hypothetical protein
MDGLFYVLLVVWSVVVWAAICRGIWLTLIRPETDKFFIWRMIRRSRKIDEFVARAGGFPKKPSPVKGIIEGS